MLRSECQSRGSSWVKSVSSAIAGRRAIPINWPLQRPPYQLETNAPGVFVAGDVRKGSVKRLTAAAGEGAQAVHYIFRHCADLR